MILKQHEFFPSEITETRDLLEQCLIVTMKIPLNRLVDAHEFPSSRAKHIERVYKLKWFEPND